MLLSGPRGDAKDQVVNEVLLSDNTPGVTYLDFGPLIERHKDERFLLKGIAQLFDFFPAMTSFTMSAAALDTIVPGASRAFGGAGGSGISEQVNSLLPKVLSFATVALSQLKRDMHDYRGITPEDHGDSESNAKVQMLKLASAKVLARGSADLVNQNGLTKSQDSGELHPLFVIQGFAQENVDLVPNLFDHMIRWAAMVTERKLAKVVFITDGSWANRRLLSTLKDRPDLLDELVWGDVPLDTVRGWLVRQQENRNWLKEEGILEST